MPQDPVQPDITRGLVNTGNTCFLNSILQSLAPLYPFHEWLRVVTIGFLRNSKEADELLSWKILAVLRSLNWPMYSVAPTAKNSLMSHFSSILTSAMGGSDVKSIDPHILGSLSDFFNEYEGEQHDAHELLMILMSRITESDITHAIEGVKMKKMSEINRMLFLKNPSTNPCSRKFSQSLLLRKGSHHEKESSSEKKSKLPFSFRNPFEFTIGRSTECLACRQITPNFSHESDSEFVSPLTWRLERDLVITVTPSADFGDFSSRMRGSMSSSVPIELLLRDYFEPSEVSGFRCSNSLCSHTVSWMNKLTGKLVTDSSAVNAIRRTVLFSTPPCLCIHVNRLQAEYKDHSRVSFGSYLSMRQFSFRNNSKDVDDDLTKRSTNNKDHELEYVLMSLVVHLGGAHGGHYISYRRIPRIYNPKENNGRVESPSASSGSNNSFLPPIDTDTGDWVKCSDEDVHPIDFNEVREVPAYLLFYVRRDIFLKSLQENHRADVAMVAVRDPFANGFPADVPVSRICAAFDNQRENDSSVMIDEDAEEEDSRISRFIRLLSHPSESTLTQDEVLVN